MKQKFSTKKAASNLFSLIICLGAFTILSFNTSNQISENEQSQDQPKYSQVRIYAVNESDFKKMTDAGLFIDHANSKPGHFLDAWLSENEINLLKKSGVPYQILIDDWNEYYNSRPKMTQQEINQQMLQAKIKDNVTHSIYGSMGGYLTYAEVVSKLDSMRMEYPQFISQKFSIGNTFEGRAMWTVRITKNPDAPTGRPEAFYNALIHAREPESMETQMYYFYWLFENYGTDPKATYILNNREIYWMPVFNADGYVYNQSTNPNGGGFWRCNRHGSGQCGWVDLNRNFGIYEYWNSSNGGSSEDSCSGGSSTYRGKAPFSENETRNYMNFVNSRNFNSIFNAHTYGNFLLKPWNWIDPVPTPDDNKFNQYLSDMSETSNYVGGSTSITLGYFVRGGADDWVYNDSAHSGHHIFGITPETGNEFWPPQSEIIPLAQNMLYSNQYMSLIAGPFVNPLTQTFNQSTYNPGDAGSIKVVFLNKGQVTALNVKVSLTPVSTNFTIPVQQFTNSSMTSFAKDSVIFNFNIGNNVPLNTALEANLTIRMDTSAIYSENIFIPVGEGVAVFNDNAEGTFSNWVTDFYWGLTSSQSHSPAHSFTDSPLGNYFDGLNNSMTLSNSINVSVSPVVYLNFYHKYSTELNYDFCNVEVSNDNGVNWQTVKSYSGALTAWTQQMFDITGFAAASPQMKVRFRLSSDGFLNDDGWYVDDVRIINYNIGPSGISPISTVPGSFILQQNYPNPFNPNTIINYQCSKFNFVSLKVYDALGNEVAVLVNENKKAGNYAVEFNGSNFPSGVYFYKLTAGLYSDVKKMLLIK